MDVPPVCLGCARMQSDKGRLNCQGVSGRRSCCGRSCVAHGVTVEGIDAAPDDYRSMLGLAGSTMAGKSALTAALAGPEDGAQKAAVPTPEKADAQSFPCLSKPASGDSVDQLADGVEALSYKDVPITGSAPTAFLAADGHAYVRSCRSNI